MLHTRTLSSSTFRRRLKTNISTSRSTSTPSVFNMLLTTVLALLAEGSGADCFQVCSPRLQMSTWVCTFIYDELCQVADVEARQRLRFSSSSSLIVSRTRLSTVGDRAFPVAAARVWNSLPEHITSAPTVTVFRSRLFSIVYPNLSFVQSSHCDG